MLGIMATHLGLSLRERRSQAMALLNMLKRRDRPTVALGDFTDWLCGSVRRSLEHALPGVFRHRIFPECLPILQLDRVCDARFRMDRSNGSCRAPCLPPSSGYRVDRTLEADFKAAFMNVRVLETL